MKKIKILQVIGALNYGGAETMILNIYENIDRSKFLFDFYLSGNSNGYYEKKFLDYGCKIYNVGRRKKAPLKYLSKLYFLLKKNHYDIVQVHGVSNSIDYLPLLVAKLAGVKKRYIFSHNSSGNNKFLHFFLRKILRHNATKMMSCSDLASTWMFGKNVNNVMIIPLPIKCELCLFNEKFSTEFRKKYKLENDIVIGHIGRYQPQKNHLRLLKIFNELHKKCNKYKLILIGTGYLQNNINIYIHDNNLDDCVIQLGEVPNACEYLSVFDTVLFPSLFEGYPTVLLEAQANGVPVVASSSITKTIDISGLVSFVDLLKNDDVWIKKIMNSARDTKKSSEYNNIVKNVHGLKRVASIYEGIYGEVK